MTTSVEVFLLSYFRDMLSSFGAAMAGPINYETTFISFKTCLKMLSNQRLHSGRETEQNGENLHTGNEQVEIHLL